jgi:hypothetical protein
MYELDKNIAAILVVMPEQKTWKSRASATTCLVL